MNHKNGLPKEVTQEVFIVLRQSRYDEKPRVVIADYDLSKLPQTGNELCVTLGRHEITLPVPQDVDVLGMHISGLKEQRQRILAEAQVKANAIEERISSLLAIEHTEARA